MKIAIFVSRFPPKWLAGTELATYNIAKHLAKRGHEVHVITSLDEGLPKHSLEYGFYIHRIRLLNVQFVGISFFWLKRFLVLIKIKPDIIHCQDLNNGLAGFLAGKFLRRPYVIWGQGTDVYMPQPLLKSLSKFLVNDADAIIALTEDMKSRLQKFAHRNIYVIPNGIDLKKFENLSRDNIQHTLQTKKGEQFLIFVGRLRPEKGMQYLIEAMRLIRNKRSSVRLIIVGEGPEEYGLKRLVEQLNLEHCVTFMGNVPNEKVPKYMAIADVFILPSLSEGLPIALLEAMAAGLPIIATRVGGIPCVLEDGKNGLLVNPGSSSDLAEKILMLMRSPELMKKMSEANREKSRSYSWENIVSQLEKLLNEVVAKKMKK